MNKRLGIFLTFLIMMSQSYASNFEEKEQLLVVSNNNVSKNRFINSTEMSEIYKNAQYQGIIAATQKKTFSISSDHPLRKEFLKNIYIFMINYTLLASTELRIEPDIVYPLLIVKKWKSSLLAYKDETFFKDEVEKINQQLVKKNQFSQEENFVKNFKKSILLSYLDLKEALQSFQDTYSILKNLDLNPISYNISSFFILIEKINIYKSQNLNQDLLSCLKSALALSDVPEYYRLDAYYTLCNYYSDQEIITLAKDTLKIIQNSPAYCFKVEKFHEKTEELARKVNKQIEQRLYCTEKLDKISTVVGKHHERLKESELRLKRSYYASTSTDYLTSDESSPKKSRLL